MRIALSNFADDLTGHKVTNNRTFHILALDGGGVRGIYPAHILARLEETTGKRVADCFDLIAGTSTGAIVAGAAAAGVELKEVVNLFELKAANIFPRRRFMNFGFLGSKYSRDALERVVREVAPDVTLGEISTPLLITSSDVSTGGVHVFKSGYLKDLGKPYIRDGGVHLADAILASCAAPSYFDPAKVDEYLLADGGLWANNPSIIALVEAVSKFRCQIEQIHVLSIGTGHSTEFYTRKRRWGLFTGWGHLKLVSYVFGLQSQASANMSKLLLGDQHFRLDPEIRDWKLDDVGSMKTLKAIADRDFSRRSREIIKIMRRD